MGRHLIKGRKQIKEIVVYSKEQGKYKEQKKMNFKFQDVCMKFEFNIKNNHEMFFFTAKCVLKYDWYAGKNPEVYMPYGDCELEDQPSVGVFNHDQSMVCVASKADCALIDIRKKQEFDLDDLYGIA